MPVVPLNRSAQLRHQSVNYEHFLYKASYSALPSSLLKLPDFSFREGGCNTSYLYLKFRRKIVPLLKPLHGEMAWRICMLRGLQEPSTREEKCHCLNLAITSSRIVPNQYPLGFDVPLSNKWYATPLPVKSGIFWITIGIQNKVSAKVNSTT